MDVDEFFSSKRKDIKSKFISENAVTEDNTSAVLAPPVDQDTRPLYQRIADVRRAKDEAYDEMYRFANRVRKLDDEEIQFYERVEQDNREKQLMISRMEKQELEKFRNAAEALKEETIDRKELIGAVDKPKRKDAQSEILNGAIRKKQRTEPQSNVKLEPSAKTQVSASQVKTTPKKVPIIANYPSSSDED